MAIKTKFKRHELSECYPAMDDQQLKDLATDIKENGLEKPIELYQGEVIDGWNRYLACEIAKVKPEVIDKTDSLDGRDLAAYVKSSNDLRRHMNLKDRAIAAAKLSKTKFYKDRANAAMTAGKATLGPKEPGVETQRAIHQAAKDVGVSPTSAKRAAKVFKDGAAATKEAMAKDKLSVSKAETIAKLPKSKQPAAVKRAIQQSRKTSQNSGAKPTKKAMLLECEKAFDILYRTALKMGIDDKKYKKHFDAIIGEINRLGGEK